MKNILVPTDFSLQSLSVVHEVINKEQECVNIYLVHLLLVPNDIAELMFNRKAHLYEQVPDDFTEAIQLFKNKYPKLIRTITLNFYYGGSVSVINSIIENKKIDEAYVLANYQYKKPFPASVNSKRLIERCSLPVKPVYPEAKIFSPAQAGSFSALLIHQQNDIEFSKKAAEEVYN